MFGEDLKAYEYIQRLESLTDAEVDRLYALHEKEARRPARAPRLHYSPDLSRNAAPVSDDVSSDSSVAIKAKVNELLQFIQKSIGRRCADAAKAIMAGARSCKEIGDKMGVCRHTAIGHVRNLQSRAVQEKAVELGLVTRRSFIQTVMKVSKPKPQATTKSGRRRQARTRSAAKAG